MSDKKYQQAKAAFAAVYNDSPADFNKIAQEAIQDRVREKIKDMRGELRDQLTDKLLSQDPK